MLTAIHFQYCSRAACIMGNPHECQHRRDHAFYSSLYTQVKFWCLLQKYLEAAPDTVGDLVSDTWYLKHKGDKFNSNIFLVWYVLGILHRAGLVRTASLTSVQWEDLVGQHIGETGEVLAKRSGSTLLADEVCITWSLKTVAILLAQRLWMPSCQP